MWLVFAACSNPPGPVPTDNTVSKTPAPTSTTGEESGGQSGEDSGYCEETVTVGDADDVVEGWYGAFTAGDLRDLANGSFDAVLDWADGGSSSLVLDLQWDGEIRVIEGSPAGCEDRIEIDGTYTSITADGRLAESGTAVLEGRQAALAMFVVTWEEATFEGSLAFPEGVSSLVMRTVLDPSGAQGWILTPGNEQLGSFAPP